MPEVLTYLRKCLFSLYDLEHKDVNIDISSVTAYAKGTELYDFDYSEDKLSDPRQVNFDAAELRDPINIPIDLSIDRRNTSSPILFVKIVDEIRSLRDDPLFVFDAGGDAKQVLDRITERNIRYITRKRLNKSDNLRISRFDKDEVYCVDENDGAYCRRRMLEASGRAAYLFHSEKPYRDKMVASERSWRYVEDAEDVMRMKSDVTLRIENCHQTVEESAHLAECGHLGKATDETIWIVSSMSAMHILTHREGFFKLECSSDLTPSEAFTIYRRRDTAESRWTL
mgnify:CR=1 FL=1